MVTYGLARKMLIHTAAIKPRRMKMKKITLFGSFLGFITFLFVGLIPSILYGGYMGLAIVGAMFGSPIETALIAKIITVGGMALGMLSVGFLFVVLGSVVGFVFGRFVQLGFSSVRKGLKVAE